MKSIKEIEVRYGETDQMGVVYHANYVVWLDLARTKFYSDLGFSIVDSEEAGVLYPVRDVNIKYLSPAKYGEKIFVETEIKEVSKIKFVYKHKVYNDLGEIKIKAETTVVCVDKDNFKLLKIDKALPEVYSKYLELVKS